MSSSSKEAKREIGMQWAGNQFLEREREWLLSRI